MARMCKRQAYLINPHCFSTLRYNYILLVPWRTFHHISGKDRPPSPVGESFAPLFKKNLSLNNKRNRIRTIVYANNAISRWYAVGLSDNDQFPSRIYSSFEHQQKPLILVKSYGNEENNELSKKYVGSPYSCKCRTWPMFFSGNFEEGNELSWFEKSKAKIGS
ncbi:uncharacterized protein LOC126666021 [Mercurialis annua]|uniref:uncharacterized protein LOC126666021 n=1 Tax=Mercurialis annua TaxID=3986 RepID=UPI00215F6B38|nr:uncharacterized protein LOC126666021 [Mercurialis annua]